VVEAHLDPRTGTSISSDARQHPSLRLTT
jgi:hypothetical protein